MKVLPQARASGNIHSGTMAGKLKGVMPATTPSGWRMDQVSMPVPTCSVNSPLRSCGMPVANSMFSRPRMTSPLASEKTLPCSRLRRAATSSMRDSKMSRRRKRTRARRSGGCADQSGKAAAAAATAALTSASVASGTRAWTRAGGGVEDVAEAAGGAADGSAVDPVGDLADGGLGGGGFGGGREGGHGGLLRGNTHGSRGF